MSKIFNKKYSLDLYLGLIVLTVSLFIIWQASLNKSNTTPINESRISIDVALGLNGLTRNLDNLKSLLVQERQDQAIANTNLGLLKLGKTATSSQLRLARKEIKALVYVKLDRGHIFGSSLSKATGIKQMEILEQINLIKLADDQQVFEVSGSKLVQSTIISVKEKNLHGDSATNLSADFTTVDGNIQNGYVLTSNNEKILASQPAANYAKLAKVDILLVTASRDNQSTLNALEAISHILSQ